MHIFEHKINFFKDACQYSKDAFPSLNNDYLSVTESLSVATLLAYLSIAKLLGIDSSHIVRCYTDHLPVHHRDIQRWDIVRCYTTHCLSITEVLSIDTLSVATCPSEIFSVETLSIATLFAYLSITEVLSIDTLSVTAVFASSWTRSDLDCN